MLCQMCGIVQKKIKDIISNRIHHSKVTSMFIYSVVFSHSHFFPSSHVAFSKNSPENDLWIWKGVEEDHDILKANSSKQVRYHISNHIECLSPQNLQYVSADVCVSLYCMCYFRLARHPRWRLYQRRTKVWSGACWSSCGQAWTCLKWSFPPSSWSHALSWTSCLTTTTMLICSHSP